MTLWLKQSTATTVKMGPFLDSTDGATAETGLTISQADIRLSKNGGNIAQSNNAAGATHDELGYYDVPLDTTDTATLGTLRVLISESGALPVWQDFMVVPANVWDSLFGADLLQVHAAEITAGLITATALADNAITAAKIASDAITAAKIATDAIGASELAADAVSEIQSGLSTLDAAGVRTAVGLASADLDTQLDALPTAAENRAEMDSNSTQLAAIVADTNELQTDGIPGLIAALNDPTATVVADAVWDEARSGHATAGTFGESFQGVFNGQAATGTLSTTQMTTNLTESTDDHFNGRIVVFLTGVLAGQATDITDYTGATKLITMTALTEAPSNGDRFVIV
jgi:hypothetical protein